MGDLQEMKSRGHRTEHRGRRAGFTLVEMMMAVSLSVMVFAAMGVLVNRCFSLWIDASAHWRLAQYVRISRERILSGGFNDPSGGLLSATEVVLDTNSVWTVLSYATLSKTAGEERIRGWPGVAMDKNIQLKSGSSDWVYGAATGTSAPPVRVDLFSPAMSNDQVSITYRLRFSAAGRIFEQPHTVRARLINVE
jgi:prepilin-type N-terminal cleavage/methylation domain-containing protein